MWLQPNSIKIKWEPPHRHVLLCQKLLKITSSSVKNSKETRLSYRQNLRYNTSDTEQLRVQKCRSLIKSIHKEQKVYTSIVCENTWCTRIFLNARTSKWECSFKTKRRVLFWKKYCTPTRPTDDRIVWKHVARAKPYGKFDDRSETRLPICRRHR